MNHLDDFVSVRGRSGCRGVVRQDWRERLPDGADLIEQVWENPGTVVRPGETGIGIEGRTSARAFDGHLLYCKIYLADRVHRHLADWIGRSRSMEEWRVNCEASRRGVPTAPVVVAHTQRRGWRFFHILCLLPAPGKAAASWLRTEKDPAIRGRCLRELGEVLAIAHKKGFFQEHYGPKHTFTDLEGGRALIDLERGRFGDPLSDKLAFRNLRQVLTATAKLALDDDEVRTVYAAYKANDPGLIAEMDRRAEKVIAMRGKKIRGYKGW